MALTVSTNRVAAAEETPYSNGPRVDTLSGRLRGLVCLHPGLLQHPGPPSTPVDTKAAGKWDGALLTQSPFPSDQLVLWPEQKHPWKAHGLQIPSGWDLVYQESLNVLKWCFFSISF